jgi:hypothetical protein
MSQPTPGFGATPAGLVALLGRTAAILGLAAALPGRLATDTVGRVPTDVATVKARASR